MEINTDVRRDLSAVRETEPKTVISAHNSLFRQTDKNKALAACDRQAQELVEQILDMAEAG